MPTYVWMPQINILLQGDHFSLPSTVMDGQTFSIAWVGYQEESTQYLVV
jgi:hypothetical protein